MSDPRAVNPQGRQAALVCAAAAILWIGAQWLGPAMGMPGQYALLFDLMALAAFVWAMVVTFRVWRRQAANPSQAEKIRNKQG